MQCVWRTEPLTSIGDAVKQKTGASTVFLLPRPDATNDDEPPENTVRAIEAMMGEVTDHLTKIKHRCTVNENFGTYAELMGLIGNIWLAHKIFFRDDPASTMMQFCELLGDALCVPTIKRWVLAQEKTHPEVLYGVLNSIEQAVICASGMTKNRFALKSVGDNDWAAVPTDAYEEIGEIATTLVAKLNDASRGGETFTYCPLWTNSKRALAIKRAREQKHASELLEIKRKLKDEFASPGDPKRSRREKDREATKAKREPTDEEKQGDLICTKYLTVPTFPGDDQPCGAWYRQGVACTRVLRGQKCKNDHTPIDKLPRETQQLWLNHVNSKIDEGYAFNPKRVTVFKKAGDKWVWA